MSNTTQYTYGVIGAAESSTTIAIDFVPAGAPAQLSGGDIGCAAEQVNRAGIVLRGNALSAIVITAGVVTVTPDENSPHPASGKLSPSAAAAEAARRPRRRPAAASASDLTAQSLGPGSGCGDRYGAARAGRAGNNPERLPASRGPSAPAPLPARPAPG